MKSVSPLAFCYGAEMQVIVLDIMQNQHGYCDSCIAVSLQQDWSDESASAKLNKVSFNDAL
jgi:hypothetical protein